MSTKEPYPKQDGGPSTRTNTPQIAPVEGLGGSEHLIEPSPGVLDLSTVDDLAGQRVQGIGDISPQDPVHDLAMIRAHFPFLPILPLRGMVSSVFLVTQLVPDDLVFRDGTTLAVFTSAFDFYISTQGNAAVPTAGDTPAQRGPDERKNFAWYGKMGTPLIFYVGGIKSVSVVSPTANAIVTALCYQTNNWIKPRKHGRGL